MRSLNRPYLTETNKMHPKKLWPKLIFGTVIKPIEFSNISQNQPYLSDRGVQNTPPKIAKNAKKLNMHALVPRGFEPTLALEQQFLAVVKLKCSSAGRAEVKKALKTLTLKNLM